MVRQEATRPRWLVSAFWVSVAIALAVVLRRLMALRAGPGDGPPATAALDAAFATHAALTTAHIIPAAVFVLLSAGVMPGRWTTPIAKTLFYLFGFVVALTAYLMNGYAVGGVMERCAVLVFDTWFMASLSRALWLGVRGAAAAEREWMIRSVGVLLGIATTRPVMGVFFATSRLTGLSPAQFFGIAFWIGFSLNVIAVELWLRARRRRLAR